MKKLLLALILVTPTAFAQTIICNDLNGVTIGIDAKGQAVNGKDGFAKASTTVEWNDKDKFAYVTNLTAAKEVMKDKITLVNKDSKFISWLFTSKSQTEIFTYSIGENKLFYSAHTQPQIEKGFYSSNFSADCKTTTK
jgi:hypothetical protein